MTTMKAELEALVVEDEGLMRRSIIKKIEASSAGFRVVGEAKNGKEALKLIRLLRPAVVFSDVYMPVMDGLALAAAIQLEFPEIRVIIISGHRDFEYAQKAIRYGVINYLIKPLESGALDEVLLSLREEILREHSGQLRQRIESLLEGGKAGTDDKRFCFFLASLGYAFDLLTAEASMRLRSLWSQLLSIVSLPEGIDWYVFNGSRANEVCFVCEDGPLAPGLAERLFAALKAASEGRPVSLCAPESSADGETLFFWRQQCSWQLLARQVIGRSEVFRLREGAEEAASQPGDVLLNMQQMNVIKTLAHTRSSVSLNKELAKLLTEWDALPCRRIVFENTLGALLWIIAGSLPSCSEQEILSAKSRILSQLALSQGLIDILPIIEKTTEELLQPEEGSLSGESLGPMIEAYIKAHFTEQLSMDALAAHFGFNLAYLTRVFKSYKQEPPLKYLISLRIERALELMRQYPDMDIKSIGEAVGYEDQHYFSRVFKNAMGVSPLKYREQLTEKTRQEREKGR